MYITASTRNIDESEIRELIERHPLATVMTYDANGEAFFSHLPVILRKGDAGFVLQGHLATRNPQSSHLRRDARVKLIFHGPSSYISPTWYRSGPDVPTWNYAVVHVEGRARMIEDFDGLVALLKSLSARFDETWKFELPDDLATPEDLCRNILGFEIEVSKVDAKFKLAQAKPFEDRASVVAELSACPEEQRRALGALMKRRL